MRVMGIGAAVAAALAVAGAGPASAESVMSGNGLHVVGWPAYDASGQLAFVACDGHVERLSEGGGSFQATDERCPSRPAPFEAKGKVSEIAPERGRLSLQDEGGAVRVFYLTTEAAKQLAQLQPDATVQVEGPVAGHVDKVTPGS